MKTSILFCCLMIVGGIAFGQKTLPDPGGATTPNTGAPISGPTSSGGTTAVGAGPSSGATSNDDGSFGFEDIAEFLGGILESIALTTEEEKE